VDRDYATLLAAQDRADQRTSSQLSIAFANKLIVSNKFPSGGKNSKPANHRHF
jgi:hypothetical protein